MRIRLALLALLYICATPLLAFQTPEEDVSKARLLLSNERWVQFHYFLQTGVNTNFNESAIENDFFIDRNRIIMNGQTAKDVYFFMQTDDVTAGEAKNTGENNVYTQDAYIHYQPMSELQFYAGLMAVPISRKNLTSDATTLLNRNSSNTVPLDGYSNNGRDTGIMLRGFLFDKILEYRFGLFQGLAPEEVTYEDSTKTFTRNEDAYPRMTTRLQVHIIDKEEGFFYSENYIGKREIFSVGLGFDFQPMVTDKYEEGDFENYFAISGDVDVQVPNGGGNAFAFGLGILYMNNNPTVDDETDLDYNDLLDFYINFGYLFVDKYQPFAEFSIRDNFGAEDGGGNFTEMRLSIGANYFLDGHHARARIQYDQPLTADLQNEDNQQKISLQMQIYL